MAESRAVEGRHAPRRFGPDSTLSAAFGKGREVQGDKTRVGRQRRRMVSRTPPNEMPPVRLVPPHGVGRAGRTNEGLSPANEVTGLYRYIIGNGELGRRLDGRELSVGLFWHPIR